MKILSTSRKHTFSSNSIQFNSAAKQAEWRALHRCADSCYEVSVLIRRVWFSPNMVPGVLAKHLHVGLICSKDIVPDILRFVQKHLCKPMLCCHVLFIAEIFSWQTIIRVHFLTEACSVWDGALEFFPVSPSSLSILGKLCILCTHQISKLPNHLFYRRCYICWKFGYQDPAGTTILTTRCTEGIKIL